ncbi:MAG: phenylalanine--tRNA ligase beta subunit-related protein [Roseiflexaceae bacterium]
MRFVIHDDFWRLFPEALIGVVIARDLDNTQAERPDIAALLANAATAAADGLSDDIATHAAIAPWRRAYQIFGVKPSKYRSSIESLLRSARAERIRSVNPLVDLYNIVSLTHLLPCGGEDLAAVDGIIRLELASGGEHFVPLGSQEAEPPQPGEVIYRDDSGVICRCWNWREADRTKLTPATTDAFLCVETLPPSGEPQLRAACAELATLAHTHLGAHTTVELLSRAHPKIEF